MVRRARRDWPLAIVCVASAGLASSAVFVAYAPGRGPVRADSAGGGKNGLRGGMLDHECEPTAGLTSSLIFGACAGVALKLRPWCRGGGDLRAKGVESCSDVLKDDGRYTVARTRTFVGMVLGYAVYYFTRLSFNYVGPALRRDMGLSMVQLGFISSVFPLAYMNSKFISGVLADVLGSPVKIFGYGLILTGVMNVGFACGSSLPWFTALWVLNGLFQGCGATPCNKMLVNWFPAASRGKWWSSWNASHNVGGFLIPIIAGGVAAVYGWRLGMIVPGVFAIVTGLACLRFMKDDPEKMGLPSAEARYLALQGDDPDPSKNTTLSPVPEEDKTPVWKVLFKNKFLWCMAVMHFLIYFIRQGILNWAHFYIMDEFGIPAAEATARVSGFELGGLAGCIASGQVSDWLITRFPEAPAAGLRTQVMFAFSLLAAISVTGLWLLPPVAVIQWLCMAAFGFAIYGPQTLITMAGVETVPRRLAATAGGILAYPAQLGSMLAGLPFAILVREYGWGGYFPSVLSISVAAALVAIPCFRTLSYSQKTAQAKGF